MKYSEIKNIDYMLVDEFSFNQFIESYKLNHNVIMHSFDDTVAYYDLDLVDTDYKCGEMEYIEAAKIAYDRYDFEVGSSYYIRSDIYSGTMIRYFGVGR